MPQTKEKRGSNSRYRNRCKMICDIMERWGIKWWDAVRMLNRCDAGCSINRKGMAYIRRWNGGIIVNPDNMSQKGYCPEHLHRAASTRKVK